MFFSDSTRNVVFIWQIFLAALMEMLIDTTIIATYHSKYGGKHNKCFSLC